MAMVVAIRGAIVARENTKAAIHEATRTLLERIIRANRLTEEAIVGVFFTCTVDLNAEFPAYVLRDMGWTRVPSLCAQEIEVPGSMTRVIRAMVFVNQGEQGEQGERSRVKHQYIGKAAELRPDLAGD